MAHYTDLGNAKRLVAQYGVHLLYCTPWRRWLIWDEIRWCADETERIMRVAKQVILGLYQQAASIETNGSREALVGHAKHSESVAALRNMLTLAASEPGIPVLPEGLNKDPWLFNVHNGTIDLRTGQLRPANREDLITKLAPVTYDQAATCPLWMRFLTTITRDTPQLMQFLQRAIGYSLTGITREQVLFIPYGLGRSGKTTMLETIAEMLGDYSMTTPTETLLVRSGDGIPNDIARLVGARLVIAVETEDGRRLASGRVKQLTGGDTITARFMRAEFFEFKPEFKIWLAVNHRPVIRDTTDSIWRRIHLIPFDVKIAEDEVDKSLPDKLRQELPGILNWAIQGCLDWQKHGLGVPPEVRTATQRYRADMDVIGEFLDECCLVAPTVKEKVSSLYSCYERWCSRNQERPVAKRQLGDTLRERGFQTRRSGSKGELEWHGIVVK